MIHCGGLFSSVRTSFFILSELMKQIFRTLVKIMNRITLGTLHICMILFFLITSCQERRKEQALISSKRVFDNINLLTDDQEKSLYTEIQALDKDIGSQIAIVIIDTLGSKDLNEVSLKTAEELNLGRVKYNDGLLIFLAFGDHKVRIEVARGLEKIIKDDIASRIMNDVMAPEFRKQHYYEGLLAMVKEISKLIRDNKDLVGKYP
jgi:uncharacterized membrane protein YgcG